MFQCPRKGQGSGAWRKERILSKVWSHQVNGVFFSLINEDKYFNLFTYKITNKDQKGLSELFLGQTRGSLLSLI